MIGALDVESAVSVFLKKNGFSVVSVDAQDGFLRPACSVDAFLSAANALNWYTEEDSFTVTILYYPLRETQEEMVKAADRLRSIMLYTPLIIKERSMDADSMSFYREDAVLFAELSYTIMQNPHENEKQPEGMEFLELEME